MSAGAGAARDAYAVLGVGRGASDVELRRAYRRAARRAHPDAGGSATAFRDVSLAWEQVGTPEARRRYDLSLGPETRVGTPSSGPRPGGGSAGAGPAVRTGRGRGGSPRSASAGVPTVRYEPPLGSDAGARGVLDETRSVQMFHGLPRRRGLLPDEHRVRRQARLLQLLSTQLVDALPAARILTGVSLGSRWQRALDVDHLVLCGDRLAVLGSVQVPDGAYTWDGVRLSAGRAAATPPLLGPAMMALQRALPHVSVGGFVLVMTDVDALHAPVIRQDRARGRGAAEADLLTEPPAAGRGFVRDLSLFLGTATDRSVVDRRTLASLVELLH